MAWWRPGSTRRIRYGACSDTGRVRSENEDAYGRFPRHASPEAEEQLFIVADGMGGHSRGREASWAAVQVVSQTFFSCGGQPASERLRRAYEAANRSIYMRARQDGRADEMGTTCTVLAMTSGQIHMAHVGDSRAYRINRQGTEQLTRDHTMVEELRREGVLTELEAREHPQRSALLRAMGIDPDLEADVWRAGSLQRGDRYLLCTDGLIDIATEEMHRLVLSHTPQQACELLVDTANDRGGYDNVTVMVIRID